MKCSDCGKAVKYAFMLIYERKDTGEEDTFGRTCLPCTIQTIGLLLAGMDLQIRVQKVEAVASRVSKDELLDVIDPVGLARKRLEAKDDKERE